MSWRLRQLVSKVDVTAASALRAADRSPAPVASKRCPEFGDYSPALRQLCASAASSLNRMCELPVACAARQGRTRQLPAD